jgi:hypothetical protein
MTDPESTLPPIKAAVKSIWAWGWAHTAISAALLGFLLGFLVGKW